MPYPCFGVETGEHHRTNLHAANASFAIEFNSQRLRGEFIIGNVWKDRACVDIHAVSTCGLDGGNPRLVEARCEIRGLSKTIRDIRFFESFVQANSHRIEVAASKPTVGGET